MMEIEMATMKDVILDLQSDHLLLHSHIQRLEGNQLALQTLIGILRRQVGCLSRKCDTQMRIFEGKSDYSVKQQQKQHIKSANKIKSQLSVLSHDLATTREISMMNRQQLELLARDFNNHSCMDSMTHSFSNSCTIVHQNEHAVAAANAELDREITETVRKIELKKAKKKPQRKRLVQPRVFSMLPL